MELTGAGSPLRTGSGRHEAAAAVIVLAGGRSRRWGGRDKTAVTLGGRTVLRILLDALPPGLPVVVVGPADHPEALPRPGGLVSWTREDPPGGGPAAGLEAGCRAVPPATTLVAVLAGDLPFAGTAVPRLLAAGSAATDGAVGIDPGRRRQPLLAAYRLAPLKAALAAAPPAGSPIRAVLSRLHVVEVQVTGQEAFDVDTPADLSTAEAMLTTP